MVNSLLHRIGRLATAALTAGFIVFLAACADEEKDVNAPRVTVDVLYNHGMDQLLAARYGVAAKTFDEVDRQHPYSVWATKAQLMAAYAYYRNGDFDEAVIGLERFIQLHPSHRDVPYAHYLKGLAYYDQIKDVKRDQSSAELALASFEQLVRRYPNTRYNRDARRRMDLILDHLAGKEMEVGRFYLERGNHLAAINRFKTVVDNYQTTSQVPEALHRLAESYTALGLTEEAQQVAAVLGYNYPASGWYVDSYAMLTGEQVARPPQPEDDGPFLARAWNWLF